MSLDWLPLVLFAPVLIYAGFSDLSRMRIPNWTSLAAIGLFAVTAGFIGWPEAGLRLLAAGAVFALGVGLWMLRFFGAGDVKLVSALLLLVPVADLHLFSQVFAASLLVGLGVVTGLRSSGLLRSTGWVSMRAAGHFPMGISIALAGLMMPFLSLYL